MLPELLIPQHVGEDLDYEAATEISACQLFLAWLQELDVRLGLLFAKPNSTLLDGGYWYIYRRNEGFPSSFWRVADENEHPCVPDQRHIEMLQRIDAAKHPDIYRNYAKRQAEARERGEKDAEEMHREFREKLLERAEHLYRTQIAVTPKMKARIDAR